MSQQDDVRFKPLVVTGTAASRCAIGVLFVHGIGTQRRGETLASFARPIYHWLEESFRRLQLRQWLRETPSLESLKISHDVLRSTSQTRGVSTENVAWALEVMNELLESQVSSQQTSAGASVTTTLAGDETVCARVLLADARLRVPESPEAPANASLVIDRLRLDGRLEEERWLFAESWWAENFSVPGFSDLARWGLGIIPWTIGSHYGAQLRRVWRARGALHHTHRTDLTAVRDGTGPLTHGATAVPVVVWIWALTAAAFRLFGGLGLSLLALLALALMMIVALLPIDRVRTTLATLQRQIASSLGDSYVVVTRPIEAAAIVSQVARDLDWLAQRCQNVVLVAHSQGAAVAHEAVRRSWPENLRLLLTFGSGLRKLEELRHVLGPGQSFRRGAGLTLLGLLVACLYGFALTQWVIAPKALSEAEEFQVFVFVLACAGAGVALLVAGLWDLVAGVELGELRRRVERFSKAGVRWIDCYASADPVPNGCLFDSTKRSTANAAGISQPRIAFPESVEICNEKSTSADHTTYWSNLDEFVGLVVAALAQVSKSWLGSIVPNQAWRDGIRRQRRWRVTWLVAVRWAAWISIVITIVRDWPDWSMTIRWGFLKVGQLLGDLVGIETSSPGSFTELPMKTTLGKLVLILLAYGFAKWLWRRWNEHEMLAGVRQTEPEQAMQIGFLMALALQLSILGWLLSFAWVATLVTALLLVTVVMGFGSYHYGLRAVPTDKLLEQTVSTSRAERAMTFLINAISWVAVPVGIALAAKEWLPAQALLRLVLPEAWIPADSWQSFALVVSFFVAFTLLSVLIANTIRRFRRRSR